MYLHACGLLHCAKLELGFFGTHAHKIMHGRARMPPLQQANHGRPKGRTMTRRHTNMWAGPRSHYVGGRFLSLAHIMPLARCLGHGGGRRRGSSGTAALSAPFALGLLADEMAEVLACSPSRPPLGNLRDDFMTSGGHR